MTDAHWLWHVVLGLGGMAVGGGIVLLSLILARLEDRDSRTRHVTRQPNSEGAQTPMTRRFTLTLALLLTLALPAFAQAPAANDKPAATPAPSAAAAVKAAPVDFEEQALIYREAALNAKVDAAISPTLNKVREQLLENIRKDKSVIDEIAAIDAARTALISRKVKEAGKSTDTHTYEPGRGVVEKPKEPAK